MRITSGVHCRLLTHYAFIPASLVLFLLPAAGGCHRGIIRARQLPSELAAPVYNSPKKLDLTRLSRSSLSSERLYPGDVVNVTVSTGIEEGDVPAWKVRISDHGAINVPLIGPVRLAGLTLPEAERVIREESIRRGIYVNPNVSVLLEKRRVNRVTVMGAVEEPDTYELPVPDSDLVAALAAAGWLTDNADTIVEIKHPPRPTPSVMQAAHGGRPQPPAQPQTIRLDLAAVAAHGGGDFRLEDGAIVIVKEKPPRTVHVMGLVKTAKQVEIPENEDLYLLDAISQAGGRTLQIADKVKIIRRIEGRAEPVIISASVREAKSNGKENIRLAAGDLVSVEETPLTFTVGTIREFVRVGLTSPFPGL
jgi:polysaccharide export outer membrane protein